jgi:GT2 family glycosyltransferase
MAIAEANTGGTLLDTPKSSRTAPTKVAAAGSRLPCSVVIPVRYGGPKFEQCLRAVAAALDPEDEIIVVADGKEAAASCDLNEKSAARLIKLPAVRGPSHARNVGARASNLDLLFFVDSDVTIPANALVRIRTVFGEEPDIAAVIGSYDDEPQETNFHSQFKNLFHHLVHQHASTEASIFWGACGAIRRDVFLDVGGYDEGYRYLEDIELGYRLKAASHRIRLVPDLQVKHLKRWSAQSLIKSDMLDRAVPWTELIWQYFIRQKLRIPNDLNLSLSYRVSLITSFLLIAALVTLCFTLWAVPVVFLSASLFLILQVPFFRFFRAKRGLRFAFQALAWRFGYDIYSGLGFCYGSLRFANASTNKVFHEVLAKLGAVGLLVSGRCVEAQLAPHLCPSQVDASASPFTEDANSPQSRA